MINVEKIQIVRMNLSNSYVLKHICKFSYKDKMGKRKGYHTIINYGNDTYMDNKFKVLTNINLYFKSYLSLECIDKSIPWELRQNINITEDNIHILLKKLKKVKKWFKKDDLYFYEEGVLKLNKEIAKELIMYVPLTKEKTLAITPAIIGDKTQIYEGILIFINNKKTYIEVTYGELKELIYKLKKCNLYSDGLALLNYLGKPLEKDTEVVSVSNIQNENEINKRTIVGNNFNRNLYKDSINTRLL